MAKIRKKFKEAKEVTGYDTRKYVAKIIYMFMLGYEIDFGYVEAVNLLSANKYQEKLIVRKAKKN
jgi:AP-2 complex subunit alpha